MRNFDGIGEIIRFHRKRSGLTQHQLATLEGVGKTLIFDLEKGKQSVRMDLLGKVLSTLNISVAFDSPLMAEYQVRFTERAHD